MASADKIFFFLMAAVLSSKGSEGETVKRDLINQQPGLEFIHLGNFGPISRLHSHPSFAPLGLTPQQTIALMNVLLQHGLLNPRALRLANGQPLLGDSYGLPFPSGNFYGVPGPVPAPAIDPYYFLLFSNYGRYLPYGLGPQGLYGSTGLPKHQPLAVFKHNKN